MIFQNRKDAGQILAEQLTEFRQRKNCIVLGLPRGGVVVAFEVAKKLDLPLDIVVPRKIGAPGNEEFAIGAITEEGEPILDYSIIDSAGIEKSYIDEVIQEEQKEARRRLKVYRGNREDLSLEGKVVILVDDGIATGYTMRAAVASVKERGVSKVIVAVPVSAKDSLSKLKAEADKVICLHAPVYFSAVGQFYEGFDQTEDEEVIQLLQQT